MATFSLGNSAAVPGAPGVYINERPGAFGTPAIATFSTTYMLVETENNVSVTRFPFNTPVAVTSVADYKALIGGKSPTARIPQLSYNCVQEFFANAQVGDLRVVRVGTPSIIVETEFLPAGTKINSSGIPSALMAGDKVYVQLILNGIPLVAGDGATGYDADGEWLGVPVEIPVNYIAGDSVNNRKIATAVSEAIASAIESNPAVRSTVYVRDSGTLNDLDPVKYAESENGYVTISATTFGGEVSVVTQNLPVGANYVFMQNAYDVNNVANQQDLPKVPQDYIQCIATAFDGQQDQGYLITPTAYAQFDALGRASVGAAAAAHCENNNYKWMALADPGPYLVTDINKYNDFAPHKPAEDLMTNMRYLIDNSIYQWTGANVEHPRLTTQELLFGVSPRTAIDQSTNTVAAGSKAGILDSANYTANVSKGPLGICLLDSDNYWPSDLKIQEVTVSGADDFTNPFNKINGKTVYLVAPAFDAGNFGSYSQNYVYFALTASDAANVSTLVNAAGGSSKMTTLPNGAISFAAGSGACQITYGSPFWDLPVEVNGQTSDLIENLTDQAVGVNTLHLPATLQNASANYRMSFQTRTIYDPRTSINTINNKDFQGAAVFTVIQHGITTGQKVYFTNSITSGGNPVFRGTNRITTTAYFAKVIDQDRFALSASLTALSAGSYIVIPNADFDANQPTILYTGILGGGETATTLTELRTLPMIRGRKYGFATGTIDNQAADASKPPANITQNPGVSIYLNNSAKIPGIGQISPWGETPEAKWLPELDLVDPGDQTTVIGNYYCVPTAKQNFATEAYLLPAIRNNTAASFNPQGGTNTGPIASFSNLNGGDGGDADGVYPGVALTGGSGTGAKADITVESGIVTQVDLTVAGAGYKLGDVVSANSASIGNVNNFNITVSAVQGGSGGTISSVYPYALAAGLKEGSTGNDVQAAINKLVGCVFNVTGGSGFAPDDITPVKAGDRLVVVSDGARASWLVVPAQDSQVKSDEGMIAGALPLYGATVEMSFLPEQTPPKELWRFDAITSTNIIDEALRGVGFNGVPQAKIIESGVDNVTHLLDDSQRYENPMGFIAYYGPWIQNAAGQWVPPSPYVTGVALRRYRAEGYHFPPAGVKYVLADAVAAQIAINSSQQNLLNPKGCNAIRTLPGYPQNSVYIWGGRTRINEKDAQQRLYQFVNTRVILNVVYGSLRNAFDNQIFNVIDGFGVVYNQIVNVGNSVLNELYVKGALFGARPSDAFQVICDERINSATSLESGIVNAKVFVTPVPTLERIQIDLIRVAIGNMQKELDAQGLGQSNAV